MLFFYGVLDEYDLLNTIVFFYEGTKSKYTAAAGLRMFQCPTRLYENSWLKNSTPLASLHQRHYTPSAVAIQL